MLEIRPTCEHCNTSLKADAKNAMICSFECTFCKTCVEIILKDVCPNCKGDFVQRPIRPKHLLDRYPTSIIVIHKPVDVEAHLKSIHTI